MGLSHATSALDLDCQEVQLTNFLIHTEPREFRSHCSVRLRRVRIDATVSVTDSESVAPLTGEDAPQESAVAESVVLTQF